MIAELEAADFVVIGTPVDNFTRAVDTEIVDRRYRAHPPYLPLVVQGQDRYVGDRPLIIVSAHGGYCGDGSPAQPDFLTPYFRTKAGPRVLHDKQDEHSPSTTMRKCRRMRDEGRS